MKKKFFLIVCCFLSGCLGSTLPSNFYLLQPQTNLNVVSNKKFNVGIEAVKIPAYIDKPQIVWQKKDSTELKISELNRWGEPLSEMIQRTVISDLSKLIPYSFIKPKTFSREDFTRIIFIEINRFDAVDGEMAYLEAWWSISNANGEITAQGKTNLSAPITHSYDSYIRTQSILIGQMAEQIAKKIN